MAIGDGALGFWSGLREVYPAAREQRCWVCKTANVLNNLPKGVQDRAIDDLHNIWMAEPREAVGKAFATFLKKYRATYESACRCVEKDRDVLLPFYREFSASVRYRKKVAGPRLSGPGWREH